MFELQRENTLWHKKYLFELRRCSSYGGSSNRELLMRIYQDIFTVPEESFELRRGSSDRKSSYRESAVNVLCKNMIQKQFSGGVP